jgi:O-methyltransferase
MNPIKNKLKKFIRSSDMLRPLAQKFLVNRRTVSARAFLEQGRLYLEILPELIADYRYSISTTYRSVLQVVNLEEVIQYIAGKKINGAFVECGTFTGGASAFALRSILRNEKQSRPYWGFDSFEGLPEPSSGDPSDATLLGIYGKDIAKSGKLVGSGICVADYDDCLQYLRGTGYPDNQIHLMKGWFQNTLNENRHKIGQIAVLRMDGDIYESTKVILEELFDNVVSGGVVIIDDYGGFAGCRNAVDKFLQSHGISPFLHYVDSGIRFFIKP